MRLSTGLYVPLAGLVGDWLGTHWQVIGRQCDRTGNCEEAIKSDLQLQKVIKKHVLGKYVADFKGQHLDGQFDVKYRRRRPIPICE